MSRKEPIKIKVEKEIIVRPEDIYEAEVVASGTGAVVKSHKRYIGKKAIIIIKSE